MTEFKEKETRFAKAMAFMDSSATDAEKDKWQPEFIKLLNELSALHNQLTAGEEGDYR